jgi:hypothetical protein
VFKNLNGLDFKKIEGNGGFWLKNDGKTKKTSEQYTTQGLLNVTIRQDFKNLSSLLEGDGKRS